MLKGFGERIKSRRKQLGWSLRTLGRECDVSASFLSDVENGKSFPSMEKVSDIAKALEVPIAWLLGEEELKDADNILVNEFKKNGMLYEIFLNKHVFPNGLTYEQMFDKIKLLEQLQEMIKKEENK